MGRLLVTGGMGHVGYETVKQAAAAGIPVLAHYMSTFRADDARAVTGDVVWVRCDLSDPYEVGMLAAAHRIDGCIHTAAVPNDKMCKPQPHRAVQSNVNGTALLLETARRQEWRRFLLVSTGSVFQDLPDATTPVPEDRVPTPRTFYAGTKRSAEILTEIYAETYGLSAASVRVSWIFGPPLVPREFEGPRGPIPEFLRRAMRGEAIVEPSGGDFAASFTFVPDCAAGLLVLYGADRLAHRAYHLGSGRNQSTFDVAEAVRAAVPGAAIDVGGGTEPWTQFIVPRGPLACERMREEFGFVPRHSLQEAVAAFAEWMRANPRSYHANGGS
ncbi:NAD(P)-dependent oxidoreductase [Marivibrio halodurans]|uniref:NAD(P)-dependent oxidoreductase n=1 Tax=Marivibrio halodurans TaxID=2039722 RepID=A0A8J7S1G4_9PROT|nr:NAD(P)-dependent oxidoreductase [Marivibrio halodurans]MBP5858602.1 NAD(P)-dependent oxidoreductase [Marivibrio halodurans]